MAYIVNKYNGVAIATVQDGTVDHTTDLTFIGKNYAGYGEVQNENFLHLPNHPDQSKVKFGMIKLLEF
jgi:hypothetical protein